VSNSEEPSIPESVFADVEANPGLIKKWVTDPEFREGLLRAPDPAAFALQEHNFTLSQDTSDWIKDRVQEHGVRKLSGAAPSNLVAF
jgi:hypothetical protein